MKLIKTAKSGNRKGTLNAILCVLIMVLMSKMAGAQQQTFIYNQYMDNLTPLNPAYSLIDKAASVNTMARKQWVGIDGAPTTFMINANMPIESINGSAGLTIMNDQFAIEHQTEVNAYFAKAIQVGVNGYLAVSLNAGLRNYIADYSSLDSTDPTFRNDVRETKPNVGFGVMYYNDKYYVGISVPELTVTSLGTASVQSNANFRNNYYLAGAVLIPTSDEITFKPAALISYESGIPVTANISGTFYLKEILGLGVNYRTDNKMAAIITVNVDNIHVGYSYEFGVSQNNLGTFNIPTHEVTIGFRFGRGSGNSKLL